MSLQGNDFQTSGGDTFKFIIFSHAYGHAHVTDDMPSVNLLNHLEALKAYEPDFFISLGDMVQNGKEDQFTIFKQSFLEKIDVPVFNAVGNHDVQNRQVYTDIFGPTSYSFQYGNAVFFVLDTEIDQCNITGEQQRMLEQGIAEALADDQIDQIYILMHKVLFLNSRKIEQSPDSRSLPNDREIFAGHNFDELMETLLIPAAKKKPLHLFAGDVGAFGGNLSPFYNKDKRANLFSYAAGIGDTELDVVFIVSNTGKNVNVQPYRLVDGKFLDLKDYSLKYWENYSQAPSDRFLQTKQELYECTVDVCQFAKNTFHLQCRYFLLILTALFFGVLITPFVWIRGRKKKKNKNKNE
jgi:3',5'-cyclic AMP phosphodiesterase CpdA